jgi:hypothetical protein
LSFSGFTIHYIDENWIFQEGLIAFKYLAEEEYDGISLSKVMADVFEDFGITDRLLGVTLDNASSNTTMLAKFEKSGCRFQSSLETGRMYGACAEP